MNSKKKANLLVFFIIAIIAFSLSTVFTSITSDLGLIELNLNNSNETMILVKNDNFTPINIDLVEKEIKVNTTNETNRTNPNDYNNTTYLNGE